MLGWLVKRRLASFQKEFNYDPQYVLEIYEASPKAFFRFSWMSGLAAHREEVSKEAWYAARLVATLAEDCGPCTQLVVTMAEREGVSSTALRSVLAGDEAGMPPDAALGFKFAKAVLQRDVAEADRLRAEVECRWGKKGLVSLALTIAASRVFPAVKYALGHGHACTQINLAGSEMGVHR
jgi:hypothetical protein